MKKILLFIAITFITLQSFGNAAMPGLWSTGNGSQFYPLFKADSIYFGKIKMQKELVLINLYKGYAVVKGEYWMLNTTNKDITMTTGYPVNGQYPQAVVKNIIFEQLYNLKVLINDSEVGYQTTLDSNNRSTGSRKEFEGTSFRNSDWYYWETTFKAGSITKLTVYFITDNSAAKLRQGYSIEKGNAFAYILETGKAWAGSIDSGRVLINLKDGLTLKDIKGIYPDSTLRGDNNHLDFSFTNLEPQPTNNILLWYTGIAYENFNLKNILAQTQTLYADIDKFPLAAYNGSFNLLSQENFKIHDSSSWILPAIFIGLAILVLMAIGVVIYVIVKLVKRSSNKRVYDH